MSRSSIVSRDRRSGRFVVKSESNPDKAYVVTFDDASPRPWKCSCPHAVYRHVECKHIECVRDDLRRQNRKAVSA